MKRTEIALIGWCFGILVGIVLLFIVGNLRQVKPKLPQIITYNSKAADPVWDKIGFAIAAGGIDITLDNDTILVFGSTSDAIRFEYDD